MYLQQGKHQILQDDNDEEGVSIDEVKLVTWIYKWS